MTVAFLCKLEIKKIHYQKVVEKGEKD